MHDLNTLAVAEYVVSNRPNKTINKFMLNTILYFIQVESIRKTGDTILDAVFTRPRKNDYPHCAIIEGIFTQGTTCDEDIIEFREPIPDEAREIIDAVMNRFLRITLREAAQIVSRDPAWDHTVPGKTITKSRLKKSAGRRDGD